MRKAPVIVPMADGSIYEIHPREASKHRNRKGQYLHEFYYRKPTRNGAYALVRVTDIGTIARIGERLSEMAAEAKRDIAREEKYGKRLVALWRWCMVFCDKMIAAVRLWWRTRKWREKGNP